MPEYTFPDNLPARPQQPTHIFRLKQPEVDESAVRAIAERFKLHGTTKRGVWRRNPTKITYSEGPMELSLYEGSGGWRYCDTARWQVDDGKTNVNLADGAAIEIAEKHVDHLGLARREEREVFSVTRLHVGVAEQATGYSEERVIDVCVTFQRIVDGLPVEGPGGKIVLYLDGNGAITAVDRIWRDIQDTHRLVEQFRPPKAALEDVQKAWGARGTGRVEVGDVRLGYFEYGWDVAQRFMQPMYIMPLKIVSYDARFVAGSEHVVPAAVESVETGAPPPIQVPYRGPRSSPDPGTAGIE